MNNQFTNNLKYQYIAHEKETMHQHGYRYIKSREPIVPRQ